MSYFLLDTKFEHERYWAVGGWLKFFALGDPDAVVVTSVALTDHDKFVSFPAVQSMFEEGKLNIWTSVGNIDSKISVVNGDVWEYAVHFRSASWSPSCTAQHFARRRMFYRIRAIESIPTLAQQTRCISVYNKTRSELFVGVYINSGSIDIAALVISFLSFCYSFRFNTC